MKTGLEIIDVIRGTDIISKYNELVYRNDTMQENRDQLVSLLIALKRSNQFYKPLLSKYSENFITDNPHQVHCSLPIMDKKTINYNFNLIFSPIDGRATQKKKTGGSTGNPFYYIVDKEHLSWFWAHIYFFWNKFSGYNPGDPFITIAGNSLRTANRKVFESIYHRLQNNYFVKGDIINDDLKINYNRTNKAVLLYGYPSSILNILKVKPALADNLSSLKAIFTTSEQLLQKTRSLIESALRVPIFDMYGANDGGILTCECDQHDGYHINSRNCLVETFENEFGMSEILLTNLSSYSFPFVRYRVGDLGSVKKAYCSCGLSWPKIIELKGRTRDLIILPDGKLIHGSWFNNLFYKHREIDGYKIVQSEDRALTIYLHITDPNKYDELSKIISKEIKTSLGDIDLNIDQLKELNPSNDKFKLIESHAV